MIIDLLKMSMANHIVCKYTAFTYHINVEGVDFTQFHALFGDIYADYDSQVDVLAEYIRIISSGAEYVNGALEVTLANKTISGDLIVGAKPIEMVTSIIKLNNELLTDYSKIFDEATKEDLQGLADYCAARIDKLSKTNWMLISISKNK